MLGFIIGIITDNKRSTYIEKIKKCWCICFRGDNRLAYRKCD